MDADELARITGTLVTAIAEAKTRAKESGIDPEFREIVRYAREMHDLLVEAMIANKAPSTEYYRGLSESAENAIEHLEALATMPDGRMQ
jgi:hypothetical protein